MLLGLASVAVGVLEPQRAGLQSGFIISTIGITAIVSGVHAMKRARWGSSVARAFGRGGAILGSVGTGLMAFAVLASGLTSVGVELPALSLPVDSGAAVLSPGILVPQAASEATSAPASPAPQAVAPADGLADGAPETQADGATSVVPATLAAERAQLTQSLGTLDFVMRQSFGPGQYPQSLGIGANAPQRILTADGRGLAAVPDGTRLLYSVAPDGSSWSATLVGSRFGAVATFSSATGSLVAG